MKLAKYETPRGDVRVGVVTDRGLVGLELEDGPDSLADLLEAVDPRAVVKTQVDAGDVTPLADARLLAPLDAQEVWAADHTYGRASLARTDAPAAAASFADHIYASDRPEIFFKATPHRVAGHLDPLRLRSDSKRTLPLGELTLVLNSRLELAGFTIGNDLSAADIESENPLYLPQAKIYRQSAGIGPWITLADAMPPLQEIGIQLLVRRGGSVVFTGEARVGEMTRSFDDLIKWLGRDNAFPEGVMLMTGTGIVPPPDFSLLVEDIVDITIDGIGTLSNPIVLGKR